MIEKILGPNANADEKDVLKAKRALGELGYYKAPKHGLTPYPDDALFSAIKEFQKNNDIKPDGIIKPGDKSSQLLTSEMEKRCT